jgi:hypothetical protein
VLAAAAEGCAWVATCVTAVSTWRRLGPVPADGSAA